MIYIAVVKVTIFLWNSIPDGKLCNTHEEAEEYIAQHKLCVNCSMKNSPEPLIKEIELSTEQKQEIDSIIWVLNPEEGISKEGKQKAIDNICEVVEDKDFCSELSRMDPEEAYAFLFEVTT